MLDTPLVNKRILLGVTGSIAAYKAVLLVRRLTELGAQVTVVMTQAAKEFVTPLTFQVLSQRLVYDDLFHSTEGMVHIRLGDESDLILIAPATAHSLAKIAHGMADDLLSSIVLSSDKPILVAPAMDGMMWENPVTRRNIQVLKEAGVGFVGPETGPLASGKVGIGRFAETERIIHAVIDHFKIDRRLEGVAVLVTAGPTREEIDPVRFLSNRSSGKMGYAMARVARRRGARVQLISGPTALTPPPDVSFQGVTTAEEMRQAVLKNFTDATLVIMAAAVADYRPRRVASSKLKKGKGTIHLELEETPDILTELGKEKGNRILVGFAAETGPVMEQVREKLTRKNLDLLVVNDITQDGAGFDTDTNIVTLVDRLGGVMELPRMTKEEVAEKIYDRIAELKSSFTGDSRCPGLS
jgi:phosphopantothenoylcysteine decarboxylase/phosphopantothenate--cysteine ligase